MGGVAMLAAGHGEPMAPAYDDRPDALVPGQRPIDSTDLRKVRFSLAVRGYRMAEVDALLARLAGQLEDAGSRRATSPDTTGTTGTPGTSGTSGTSEGPAPALLVRETAVRWAAEHPLGDDILDFSTASVDQVESLLDQWSRRPGRVAADSNDEVWAAGAYVGEILVRAVPGAAWSQHEVFGSTPVVRMPSGRHENPIGKAMSRYEGDESDSIAFFLQAALAAERRVDRAADERPG
jgi:DivIVA domain-containing protein